METERERNIRYLNEMLDAYDAGVGKGIVVSLSDAREKREARLRLKQARRLAQSSELRARKDDEE